MFNSIYGGFSATSSSGGGGTITGSGASGQVAFWTSASAISGNNNIFVDTGTFFLGLGTTSPVSILNIQEASNATVRGLVMDNSFAGTSSAKFYTRKSRSNGVITTGDVLGNWTSAGHDGTSYVDAADIRVLSTGAISTGVVSGQIILRTANTSGTLTQALLIDKDQTVLFGSDTIYSSAKGIKDANGNYLLVFPTAVASATNYFTLSNSIATSDITFGAATGSGDTNVSIIYATKGTGDHKFNSRILLSDAGTYKTTLDVSSSNVLRIANGFGSITTPVSGITTSSATVTWTTGSWVLSSATTSTETLQIQKGANLTLQNTVYRLLHISPTSGHNTSGTGSVSCVLLDPTINQSGSANQVTIGLDFNPVLTSVLGAVHGIRLRAGTASAGAGAIWNIFADGTANSGIAGKLYLGGTITTPTAYLHLAAGTATANTAPLKFTSGTNLTTAETGAVEYNGTNLFFTRTGTTRETIWVGNDGASAPATNTIGVIVDYYGTSATRVLTTPNSWGSVVVAGSTYKIPLYS